MKECTSCKKTKDLKDFHRNGDGFSYRCVQCKKDYDASRKFTFEVLSSQIYTNQKKRSKRRDHSIPTYSLTELRSWLRSQPQLESLMEAWRLSANPSMDVPSVDRIDNEIGYTMENIQLMTWRENQDKEIKSKSIPVNQYLNGEFIKRWDSGSSAMRTLGISRVNISKCCRGKNKSSGGFTWEYDK